MSMTRVLSSIAAVVVLAVMAMPARAAFHVYRIAEVFSSTDGSVQFVRLHCPAGADFQSFWSGQSLTCTDGVTTHTLVFPSNLPSTATANSDVLVATANFAALPGGVTPDFIIPAGFLFTGGGTLTFAPGNFIPSVVYAALPSDGQSSISATGVPQVNTPANFARQTGSVNVPPGSCCIGAACTTTIQISCTGTWTSGGSCAANPCSPPPTGACCVGTACTSTTQAACTGTWTVSVACATNPCGPPPGVCCAGVTCRVDTAANCTGVNTLFVSAAGCNGPGNNATPCCRADFNHINGISVQDIFDYLGLWFASSPTTDFLGNGAGAPTVNSIFSFLNAWFTGC
jgi:hypothetical protein